MIVSEFRLPLRKLPDACCGGAALALADGPSLAEYSLQDIQRCGATLCCYGRTAGIISCKHYWIWDAAHCGIIKDADTIDHVYACGPIFDSEAIKQIPQHGWLQASADCTFHPVIELLEGRCINQERFEFIFVLGVDGYRRSVGTMRKSIYATHLRHVVDVDSEYIQSETAWHQMNNSLNLYLSRSSPRIQNLGPSSAYSIVWGVDTDVLSQPFGRIDRQAPALIFDCTGMFLPGSQVSPYAPLPIRSLVHLIKQSRSINPITPIFVRCRDSDLEQFDRRLEGDDILCGGPECQVGEDTLFHSVSTSYLPGPSD